VVPYYLQIILMDTNSINKLTTVSLLHCTFLYLKVQKGLLKCHCVNFSHIFFSNAVPYKVKKKKEKKWMGKNQ
jgi:hypothetical protein